MLHEKKSEAIIQWFNILSDGKGVESFKDFSDGSCFASFINVLLSEAASLSESEDLSKEQTAPSDSSPDKDEKESGRRSKRTTSRISSTKSNPTKKNFEEIQKFIDGHFHLQSNLQISYTDCAAGNELQLAKVAVLVLSAAVEFYINGNYKKIENTMQLDNFIQDEIKDCLAVCLDNKPSRMEELTTALGRSARSKGRRSSVRVNEIKTFESPLKEFIESPTVYKLAAKKKEQEVCKLRKSLYFEESRVDELNSEIANLKTELEKTKKANATLKSSHQRLQQDYEDLEKAKELVVEDFDSKQTNIKKLKNDVSVLEAENKDYKNMVDTMAKEIDSLKKSSTFKDHKIDDLNQEVKRLNSEIDSLKEEMALEAAKHEEQAKKPGYQIHITHMLEEVEKQLKDKTDECSKWHEELIEEKGKTERLKKKLNDMTSEKDEAVGRINELMERVLEAKETKTKLDEQIENYKKLLNQSSGKVVTRATDKLQMAADILSKCKTKMSEASKAPETSTPKLGRLWDKQPKDDSPVSSRLSISEDSLREIRADLQALISVFKKNCVMHEREFHPLDVACRKLNSVGDVPPLLKDLKTLVASGSLFMIPESQHQEASASRSSARKPSPSRKKAADSADKEKEVDEKYKAFIDKLQENFKATIKMRENEIQSLKETLREHKNEISSMQEKVDKFDRAAKNIGSRYQTSKKYIARLVRENQQISATFSEYRTAKESEDCERCLLLRREVRDERRDKEQAERSATEMRALIRNLEGKNSYLTSQVRELTKQNHDLEAELKSNAVFVNGSMSERTALVLQYFKEGVAANEAMEAKKQQEEKKAPIVNVNTYLSLRSKDEYVNSKKVESKSSCSVTNSSFRGGYFPPEDEEDFLNHSSLAEIRAGPSRLDELQRRNTLCPPHLQSSYPTELENTPSEHKYYVAPRDDDAEEEEEASFCGAKRKAESSAPVSKRRLSTSSTVPIVSQPRPSGAFYNRTPIRKTGSTLGGPPKTFKTPASIKKLLQRRKMRR